MASLSDLQAGDQVIVRKHRYTREDQLTLAEVERTTKTQIIVEGARYRKSDGKELVSGLRPDRVELPTAEAVCEARCQRVKNLVLRKIAGVRWADLNPLALVQVYAILVRWGVLGEQENA